MKAVIPLAGRGSRLRPQTLHTPKALVRVGGQPVLSYLLDGLLEIGIDEMVLVVGYLQDELRAFLAAEYPHVTTHYVEQPVPDGTASAIKLTEPWADEELLILFSDTLFDADLGMISRLEPGYAGVIWAKEVEDYQRFGVIVTGEDGTMERIVEKPTEPISKLANIGCYYIRDHALLFEGIDDTLERGPGPGGEYFLTDAFQYMVDHGARILTAPVGGWYDCGKPETLLETNRHLLETSRGGVADDASVTGAEIVQPVRIESGTVVKGGRVGPNVTLERGARVVDSRLEHCIVGERARITGAELHHSLVGADAVVSGMEGSLEVTDFSKVEA